jgi:predicted NUDIX family NTP pyrophosphohydrolase
MTTVQRYFNYSVNNYKHYNICNNNYDVIKYPRYTSFGIIPFVIIDNKIYYVLVQRKETISFILFLKNKIEKMRLNEVEEINRMTKKEKQYLLDILKWDKTKKFNSELANNIEKYIDIISNDTYGELEWFFPKGRRNNSNEPEYITAIREFYEETEFSKCIKHLYINNKISCYKYGSDKRKYNYVLYPALLDIKYSVLSTDNKIVAINSNEVSNIGLFKFEEMKEKINKSVPGLVDKINHEISFITDSKLTFN